MKTAAQWIFIVCLPVLLLSAVIGFLANSLWLYEYGAHKYGVGQSLADAGLKLSDSELSGIYAGLITTTTPVKSMSTLPWSKMENQLMCLRPRKSFILRT